MNTLRFILPFLSILAGCAAVEKQPVTPLRGVDNAVVGTLRQKVESNWIIPPNWNTKGLHEVIVAVKTDEDGNVVDVRMTQSSGDDMVDHALLRGIRKSSPLPVPKGDARFRNLEFVFETRR